MISEIAPDCEKKFSFSPPLEMYIDNSKEEMYTNFRV